MTDLSPAAQQVLWEFNRAASGRPDDWHYLPAIAAALRAAAEQAAPFSTNLRQNQIHQHLVAIATELEAPVVIPTSMSNEITLLDTIAELISNGDDAHHFRETALEAVCYTASWLRKEGFWQAADVLITKINDDYGEPE